MYDASRRNLLHVSRGVFSNKTFFVFAHEDHLCHRTDFLFEALVAMLRACVFLRRHHTFPRQRLELAAAQSHTEQGPNSPKKRYSPGPNPPKENTHQDQTHKKMILTRTKLTQKNTHQDQTQQKKRSPGPNSPQKKNTH